ncbi:hypothetical protein BDV93DRAFT_526901 [Ceratobasidium sp. AG-I]|nr:hypothetical protein BDV93DRAFT_526901 [Ceratobasidium sp. AG-I]
MNTTRRVVETPEMLRLICELSDSLDQAHLASVSRWFFKIAAPVIWENVEGVHNLLVLLPGVQTRACENDSAEQIVSIPTGPLYFERFMVYAPLVKDLEIYDDNIKRYSVSNWRGLVVHARNATLLPNLKRLTLDSQFDSRNQFMWIRTFLSPSLVNIEAADYFQDTPLISYLEASTLLRHITAICTNLEVLSLFPDSDRPDTTVGEVRDTRAMLDLWDSSLPQYLDQMVLLRQLTSTSEVLQPGALEQLAKLTRLESLVIHSATAALQASDAVSEYTFPSLRHFELHSYNHIFVDNIWRFGFFKALTSLTLYFFVFPDVDEPQQAWGSRLISMICDASPSLVKLEIDFNGGEDMEERRFLVGSLPLLQPMRNLFLDDLFLRGASLGEYSDEIYSVVPTVWTNLTVLEMPDQKGTPQTLYWFSELPNLKRLSLWLTLQTPEPDTMRISNPKNYCFETLESTGNVEITGDMLQITRWLLSLWPTLKQVNWDFDCDDDTGLSRLASETMASGLNSLVTLLREPSGQNQQPNA